MADALTRLADAVEAGTLGDNAFCAMWHGSGLCIEADGAYNGSLDAAKALHEAVFPALRYQWNIAVEANFGGYVCNIFSCEHDRYIATTCNPDPARAWLLAILRALAQVSK